MTKEYEERKRNNHRQWPYRLLRAVVVIALGVIGALFLLMVMIPYGWLELFQSGN